MKKTKPVIDYSKWRDSDEEVVETCPAGVFEKVAKKVVVAKPNECIGCRSCEIRFPHSIKVVEEGDGDETDPDDDFKE